MSKRLLILSCSQRKRPDPGLLPAIERYVKDEYMLTYLTTNLSDSPAQTLVNPVNTVGVMGKTLI